MTDYQNLVTIIFTNTKKFSSMADDQKQIKKHSFPPLLDIW